MKYLKSYSLFEEITESMKWNDALKVLAGFITHPEIWESDPDRWVELIDSRTKNKPGDPLSLEFKKRPQSQTNFDWVVYSLLMGDNVFANSISGMETIMQKYGDHDVTARVIYFLMHGECDDKYKPRWEDVEL